MFLPDFPFARKSWHEMEMEENEDPLKDETAWPTERLFPRVPFDDSKKDIAANQESYKVAGGDIERRPSYGN